MDTDKPYIMMEGSTFILRPPEDIWKFLLEMANEKLWRKGLVEARLTSNEPFGLGSTGVHIVKPMGEMPWKITEWEEQHLIGWDIVSGRFEGIHSSYRIEPEAGGTRLMVRVEMRGGVLFRIFMTIIKPIVAHRMAGDLNKLKVIMED